MKPPWDEWPKWDTEHSFRTPRFRFDCSISDYTGKTSPDKIALLKDRNFLEIYRDFIIEKPLGSIFEIGFFQGGMPLFLADMAAPKKIVAVDWNSPSDELIDSDRTQQPFFLDRVDRRRGSGRHGTHPIDPRRPIWIRAS